eukprot:7948992-Karenia_brevis.AAC.1
MHGRRLQLQGNLTRALFISADAGRFNVIDGSLPPANFQKIKSSQTKCAVSTRTCNPFNLHP